LVIDVVNKIHLLEPAKHPLVTLLTQVGRVFDGKSWTGSGMLKQSAHNPEFKWLENYYGGRYAKVSGTYTTAAAQAPTVTGAGSSSGNIFTTGDIVKNARTGECMVVTWASTTTVTLTTRSFGSTAAAAGVDGDGLFIIGNVNEENASARNVNTVRSSTESNYLQIFRTSIAVSETEKNSELYGGSDLTFYRAKKGTEHGLDKLMSPILVMV
jgi:hypothetical protein